MYLNGSQYHLVPLQWKQRQATSTLTSVNNLCLDRNSTMRWKNTAVYMFKQKMKHFEWHTIGSLRYTGSENMTGVQARFFVFSLSQVQLELQGSQLHGILSSLHELKFTNDLGIPKGHSLGSTCQGAMGTGWKQVAPRSSSFHTLPQGESQQQKVMRIRLCTNQLVGASGSTAGTHRSGKRDMKRTCGYVETFHKEENPWAFPPILRAKMTSVLTPFNTYLLPLSQLSHAFHHRSISYPQYWRETSG